MKYMVMLFVVVVAISVAAEVRADEYPWSERVNPSPDASYSQCLAEGYVREVSAIDGTGPERIRLYYGTLKGPLQTNSFQVEIAHGERRDTLTVSDHGAPGIYRLVRYFSEKDSGTIMVGYDPRSKFIGFRKSIEGTVIKVEDERSFLFLTRDYGLIEVISADQMLNDRSVAYRSFFGSHEGLRARLDVIIFPQADGVAVLLQPAEYLKQYPLSGTVVRGQ